MRASEFRAIRKGLGLTAYQWGKLLGYRGSATVIKIQISRMERARRDIPAQVALLAESYRANGVPRHRLALLDVL